MLAALPLNMNSATNHFIASPVCTGLYGAWMTAGTSREQRKPSR